MSKYKSYTQQQLDEHYSSFLVNSWSYSRISQFARNEKAFEKIYIYGERGRQSASSVAGSAYHYAVEQYFKAKKDEGKTLDLVDLEILALEYIGTVTPNRFKLQKTTPTVEDCVKKATTMAINGLRFFYKEKGIYEDDIAQILDVELSGEVWITVNGVDIPLPCQLRIDKSALTHSGKVVIIDHKLKSNYSDEAEIILSNGNQATIYALAYKEMEGLDVDEVWFIENKVSENKDKTPQLRKHVIELNDDTIRLFGLQLYEPLKRMIAAVSDPDYIYLNNPSDNFVDKAEMYEFWAKTMIAEVDDFNVSPLKRDMVANRLKKVRDASSTMITPKVISSYKESASKFIQYDLSNKNMTPEQKIEHVLSTFGIIVKVAHKFSGYSSATFLLEVSAGTKISSVSARSKDIANGLDVESVRIGKDLMVHQGKSYLPVEFSIVRAGILNFDKSEIRPGIIPIGKDNFGNTVIWDLKNHSTTNLLICGQVGSGKSVCIKTIIESAKEAGVEQVIIFDPKYEFASYRNRGFEVYNEIIEIEEEMARLVDTMQNMIKNGETSSILFIFDEFADAIANSRKGKELDVYETVEVGHYKQSIGQQMMGLPPQPKTQRQKTGELKSLAENLQILAQKGRSSGFRGVIGTQRASTNVITGDVKVNFPVQICFRVNKEVDSRVVLDEPGAESLTGYGDGLIKSPQYRDTIRFQGFYTE